MAEAAAPSNIGGELGMFHVEQYLDQLVLDVRLQ